MEGIFYFWVILRGSFVLVVLRCNFIDCDCMCILFGIRIDLDIYFIGKKKYFLNFNFLYVCVIVFNYILLEIWFDNNLSLKCVYI